MESLLSKIAHFEVNLTLIKHAVQNKTQEKLLQKPQLIFSFKAGVVKAITAALRMFFQKIYCAIYSLRTTVVVIWQIPELRFKGDFYNFLLTTVFPGGVGSQVHKVTTSGALH